MARSRVPLILTVVCLVLAACAPRLEPAYQPPNPNDAVERERNREAFETLRARGQGESSADANVVAGNRAGYELPVLPVTVLEPPPVPAERGEGRIARDDLRSFVEQGPHALFRSVVLEAVVEGERFRGYRVAGLSTELEALRGSGLRVGDVVTAVNGTDISRPEVFMRLWESIAEADRLTVEIVREGNPRTMAWAIR